MFIVSTFVLAAEILLCEEIATMLILWLSLITQQLPIDHIQKEVCVVGRFNVHLFHVRTTCWTIVVIVTMVRWVCVLAIPFLIL